MLSSGTLTVSSGATDVAASCMGITFFVNWNMSNSALCTTDSITKRSLAFCLYNNQRMSLMDIMDISTSYELC